MSAPPRPGTNELMRASNAAHYPGFVPTGMIPLLNSSGNPVTVSNPSVGLYAAAYKGSSANIIIAYQGTATTAQIVGQDGAIVV